MTNTYTAGAGEFDLLDPFDGRTSHNADEGWAYPLDDSGLRGAPIVWRCRTAEQADRLARIFAGDLDASPGRARFTAKGRDDEEEEVARRVRTDEQRAYRARRRERVQRQAKARALQSSFLAAVLGLDV